MSGHPRLARSPGPLLLSLLLLHFAYADVTTPVTSLRGSDRHVISADGTRQCGDHNVPCTCRGDTAHCSDSDQGLLLYIPKLPTNIRILELSDGRFDPRKKTWSKEFFLNVTHITTLDVTSVSLKNITPDALQPFHNLTLVALDVWIMSGFESLANVLTVPTLVEVRVLGWQLGAVPRDIFNRTTFSRLEKLDLSYCSVSGTVDLSEFQPFTNLRYLSLEGNNVRDLKAENAVGLETLILNRNWGLKNFPTTCQGNVSLFPELRHLELREIMLKKIPYEVCLPKLTHLDLIHNPLKDIKAGAFNDELFPSLTELYLDRIQPLPSTVLGEITFQNGMLKNLSLSNCKIDFSVPYVVHDNAFVNCTKLSRLELTGNNFYDVDDDRFLKLFGHLPLTDLLLENCKIEAMSVKVFQHFPSLKFIDLGSNGIRSIPDGTFDLLLHLSRLYLYNNKITTINENTFSADTRKRLTDLGLGGNPLQCSCDLLWFKSWLESSASLRKQKINCHNGPLVLDWSLPAQRCLLSRQTSVLIIIVCSLLLLTLTAVNVFHRYRWHLRLLLYEAFRAPGEARRQRLEAGRFEYDVFVSYTSEDLPWVRQHLMPHLEDHVGLQLCIHERDFIPGTQIVDNIVHCVESSKKVLMVFSRDFVHSQWCQFELALCLRHVMDVDDALVIVCVDDVASRDMTAAMMAVLKTTTYIQWAEEQDAVNSFWGRLELSLQEVIERVER